MSPVTMNGLRPGVLERDQLWPSICYIYVEFLDWILNSGFGTGPFVSLAVINYAVKNFILF